MCRRDYLVSLNLVSIYEPPQVDRFVTPSSRSLLQPSPVEFQLQPPPLSFILVSPFLFSLQFGLPPFFSRCLRVRLPTPQSRSRGATAGSSDPSGSQTTPHLWAANPWGRSC
ncbi:hypothetical protein BDV18DRAFT_52280 [Aspergillus unguis]